MAVIVTGVPSIGVEKIWPHCEGFIARALKYAYGCYEAVDLRDACIATRMQLWVAMDTDTREVIAAVLTRISVYPRKKALGVPFGGGRRMREWMDAMGDTLEAYAKQHGCEFMEGGARKGWIRARGWRSLGVMLVKDL